MLLYPLIWIGLSLLIASGGKRKKIGFTNLLLVCLIFSPLIGLVVFIINPDKEPSSISHSSQWKEDLNQAERAEVTGDKETALKYYRLSFREYSLVKPAKVAQGTYEVTRKDLEQNIKRLERELS